MMRSRVLTAALVLWPALHCGGVAALDLPVAGSMVRVPVKHLKQVRFQQTTRQQYDFSCGSAALATLLSHHYGHPIDEQTIFEQMFRDGDQAKIKREGFSLLDMKNFLAKRGFGGDGFQLPLAKLIEAKLPAIVLISENGYNHFVVVKGIDQGRVLLGDPSSGTRAISLERFDTIWRTRLLFVIHQFKGKAVFNDAADWKVAPVAPRDLGIYRDSLELVTRDVKGALDF